MKTSLLASARKCLIAAKGNWPSIARKSRVPLRTLEKIARGEIENPGVRHIESLLKYFDKR